MFETVASGSEGKQNRTLDLTAALHKAKGAKSDVAIRPLAPVVSPSHSDASFTSFFTAYEDKGVEAKNSETSKGTAAAAVPSDQPPQPFPRPQTSSAPEDRVVSDHLTVDLSTVAASQSLPACLAEPVVAGMHPAFDFAAIPVHERATPHISLQLVRDQKKGTQSTTIFPAASDHAQSEYGTALIHRNARGENPITGTPRSAGLQPGNMSRPAVATMTTVDAYPTSHRQLAGMFDLSIPFTIVQFLVFYCRAHYGPRDHGSEREETGILLANHEGDKGCRANCCRQYQLVKFPSSIRLVRCHCFQLCLPAGWDFMLAQYPLTDPSGKDCVLQNGLGISRNMVDTCKKYVQGRSYP